MLGVLGVLGLLRVSRVSGMLRTLGQDRWTEDFFSGWTDGWWRGWRFEELPCDEAACASAWGLHTGVQRPGIAPWSAYCPGSTHAIGQLPATPQPPYLSAGLPLNQPPLLAGGVVPSPGGPARQ